MPEETRDMGPDNGKRPDSLTRADQALGKVGTGQGYSGQEFDSAARTSGAKRNRSTTRPRMALLSAAERARVAARRAKIMM